LNKSEIINIATHEGYEVAEKNTPEGKRLFLGYGVSENDGIKGFAKGLFLEIMAHTVIVYYSQSGKTIKLTEKQLKSVLKEYKKNGLRIFKDYEDNKEA